jgi:tRNA pseudouridine synthase 10
LLDQKEPLVKKIRSAAREYQFETFLVGASLPTQIYDREDAMRARLKIRGRESAKSQLTRELGIAFAKATRKKVDYLLPDLVINLAIDKENNVNVSMKSRPIMFQGRYTKSSRSLAQKQDRCPSCEGKGCASCDHSGLSGFDSVEGLIARELMKMTGGQTPKFSWIGSEDKSSLVVGRGRPFYAKVLDPRKRRVGKKRIQNESVRAILSPVENASAAPVPFRVKTRVLVRCGRALTREDLVKLRALTGVQVKFDNGSKIASKKIYSAVAKRSDDNTASLTIVADGGLMIKQFVGGQEYMSPNLSELLGSKCECLAFDILDVVVQDKPAML